MAHLSNGRRIENPYARSLNSTASAGQPLSLPVDAIDFDSVSPPDAVLLQAVLEAEQWILRQRANHEENNNTNHRPRAAGSLGSFPTIPTAAATPVTRSITQSSCDTIHRQPESRSSEDEDEFWGDDRLYDESSPPGALTQMVAEEKSKQEVCKDFARITAHLQQMRSYLEHFVSNLLTEAGAPLPKNLYDRINALQMRRIVSPLFAQHMHELRNLGNVGVHAYGKTLPNKEECERVVRQYQASKKLFEKSKAR